MQPSLDPTPLGLLDLCQQTYVSPGLTAGPEGRDGATVTSLAGQCVLCFRGTVCADVVTPQTAIIDWLNDCHREPVSWPNIPGRVHGGFLDSLLRLWGLLEPARLTAPLTITGHSKGGALAFLAGWLLRGYRPQVVTFAAPRVGDSTFAAAYAVSGPPTVRYENPHDIVPRLPLVGYDAVGTALLPPSGWRAPLGVAANHHLRTYRSFVASEPPEKAA